jgi:hypothetical protein
LVKLLAREGKFASVHRESAIALSIDSGSTVTGFMSLLRQ